MNGIVIITLAVLLAIIVIGWLLYAFQSRGKNVSKGFENVQKAANVADTVTDIAAAIAPNQITSTLQKIADAAKISVNSAEQLYLNGSITADQRKEEAKTILKPHLALTALPMRAMWQALATPLWKQLYGRCRKLESKRQQRPLPQQRRPPNPKRLRI